MLFVFQTFTRWYSFTEYLYEVGGKASSVLSGDHVTWPVNNMGNLCIQRHHVRYYYDEMETSWVKVKGIAWTLRLPQHRSYPGLKSTPETLGMEGWLFRSDAATLGDRVGAKASHVLKGQESTYLRILLLHRCCTITVTPWEHAWLKLLIKFLVNFMLCTDTDCHQQ